MVDLLSPENENICTEEVSNKALVARILENVNDAEQIESFLKNKDAAHPLISSNRQFAALALYKGMCDIYNDPCSIRNLPT